MTNRRTISTLVASAGAALLIAFAAGCGSGNASTSMAPPTSDPPTTVRPAPPAVAVGSSGLGTILVDSQGRTVYMFGADSGTTSDCADACAAAWPPVTATGTPTTGTGANAALLATSSRSDGTNQVTYNGHPLYTFVGDQKAGQTNGEGRVAFGGRWSALSPAGVPIAAPPPTTVAPPTTAKPPPPPPPPPPTMAPAPPPPRDPGVPQNGGGDGDSDNNGGPDDGDGGV